MAYDITLLEALAKNIANVQTVKILSDAIAEIRRLQEVEMKREATPEERGQRFKPAQGQN